MFSLRSSDTQSQVLGQKIQTKKLKKTKFTWILTGSSNSSLYGYTYRSSALGTSEPVSSALTDKDGLDLCRCSLHRSEVICSSLVVPDTYRRRSGTGWCPARPGCPVACVGVFVGRQSLCKKWRRCLLHRRGRSTT